MEGRIVIVRKLVALDLVLHGPKFIGIEFGIGTPVILAVGGYLATGPPGLGRLLGLYLLLIGINYIPVLAYTIILLRTRSWKSEVEEGIATNPHYIRKYSTQQLLIFVPFAIVLLATYQELEQKRLTTAHGYPMTLAI